MCVCLCVCVCVIDVFTYCVCVCACACVCLVYITQVCVCVCVFEILSFCDLAYEFPYAMFVCCVCRAHCVLIRKLEKRIDVALQHKRFRRHGVFVRLSSRSPKDGQPLQVKSALAKYEKAFQELKSTADEKNGYGDNPNTQMMALFKSQQPFWCVGSGKEALSLLLTSERVFIDLIRAIACTQTPNDKWSTNVIFRAWNPQLDESYEFRCFVHNGKLTAISQYNHYCVLRHLHPQKKRIQDLIVKFWQSLHPCLPTKTYSSYVVDLAIVGPKKDQVIVVELNPYAISTGPSLFHWTIDKEVLHKGPLQFRLRDKPMDNIKTYVEYLLDEMRSYTKAKPWWYLLDQLEQ